MDPGAICLVECSALERSAQVLEGEISGLATIFHRWTPGSPGTVELAALPGRHRVLIIIEGSGTVCSGDWAQAFDGPSVAIPPFESPATVAAAPGAAMLELQWSMVPGDAAALTAGAPQLPYFLPYASARPYSEAIKSAQTVSRTLVPTGVVPRFAAGSVQTRGPDAVGAHAHPMLEQLFLGLPGNACTVDADGRIAALGGGTLLHIPLGSTHGVRVDAGAELHYVWLDFFRDAAGERWISDMHRDL